uniref:Uncharacterized protein n=1 Tax=Rhizophora mucronata TaxID=61149 RepID=A0A2P2PFU9_RHIMU
MLFLQLMLGDLLRADKEFAHMPLF